MTLVLVDETGSELLVEVCTVVCGPVLVVEVEPSVGWVIVLEVVEGLVLVEELTAEVEVVVGLLEVVT